MARTRSWSDLSAGSRNRYLKRAAAKGWSGGQFRRYYESGGNLAEFRGHARTPERPERATRNPQRYGEYRRSGRGGKTMRVFTPDGLRSVEHLSKRERSIVGRHANAVKRALLGDDDGLERFTGVEVNGVPLETDLGRMWRTYDPMDFRFEDLYPEVAA
jgi:hypothetical protein